MTGVAASGRVIVLRTGPHGGAAPSAGQDPPFAGRQHARPRQTGNSPGQNRAIFTQRDRPEGDAATYHELWLRKAGKSGAE